MTTNQTIDGVPRELLERLLIAVTHDFATIGEVRELRALLDDDKVNNRQMGLMQFVEAHPVKSAAQPQGEPVAWAWVDEKGEHGVTLRWDVAKHLPYFVKPLYAEQPAPLKIGHGVTVKNIGFGSEEDRKPYLVFADNGNLTEVNLIDVSLVSKRRVYTVRELREIGVQVEQPAPVAAKHTMKTIMEAVERSSEYTVLTSNQCAALAAALNTK